MRIFVNNADTYLGKALLKELTKRREKGINRVFGTLLGSPEDAEKNDVKLKRVVSREDEKKRKKMTETLMSCRVIIYDLFSASEEDMQFAMSVLKQIQAAGQTAPEATAEVILIIVSSVMVWAGTQAANQVLRDQDYGMRTPIKDSRYEHWLRREELMMSTFNVEDSKVRCYVIGAGVLYGEGEDVFAHVFKAAWLGEKQQPIVSPGRNRIPTVHVRDLARLVRQICHNDEGAGDPMLPPYMLAVDQPPYVEQPEPVPEASVHSQEGDPGPGGEEVEEESAEGDSVVESDTSKALPGIDIPAGIEAPAEPELSKEGSLLNSAVEIKSDVGDPGPEPAPSTQAEILQGIVDEFCKYSDEHYEVAMLGRDEIPPLAEGDEDTQDDVKHLRELQDVLALDLNMAPTEIMLGPSFGADQDVPGWLCQQGLLHNIGSVAAEFCKHQKLRSMRVIVMGPPASGKSTLAAAVAEHFNVPHMECAPHEDWEDIGQWLKSRVCHYRGYVLDGPAISPDDVLRLFAEQVEVTEEEEEEAAEAPAVEDEDHEEAEEKPKKYETKILEALCPEYVIVLEANEDLCRARWTNRGAGSVEEFQTRFQLYEASNLADEGPTVSGFFQETANVSVFNMPIAGKHEEDMFESVRIYMEKTGRPYNYLPSEEAVHEGILSELEARRLKGAELAAAEAQDRHGDAEEEQRVAAQLQGERMKIVEQHELAQQELHALSLRQYLMTYMVPHVSEGLIEVCKVLPENPVDYLATFLEQQADNMQTQGS